jgi:plasmid maintenance system antidote protein VapI
MNRPTAKARTEQGEVIVQGCDLAGLSLRELARLCEIPVSRLDRYVNQGSRIRYEDGLKVETVLRLERGRLSPVFREWIRKWRRRAS